MRGVVRYAILLATSGCSASLGPVGVLAPESARVGIKLLRPAVSGRSCRSSVLGVPLARGSPELREAMAEILALDAEGNAVAGAEVRWEELLTGVYNRRCVYVTGDLARVITTVTLPALPGHRGHH